MSELFNIPIRTPQGTETTLEPYRGQVLLIVNVASQCGFTPQYTQLEELYQRHKNEGLTILGFPCNQFLWQEPKSDTEIQQFCSTKYSVTFPVFAKVKVNGGDAHPLYRYLKSQKRGTLGSSFIKWNFSKFLVDRNGEVVGRFGPLTAPNALEAKINELLRTSEDEPSKG